MATSSKTEEVVTCTKVAVNEAKTWTEFNMFWKESTEYAMGKMYHYTRQQEAVKGNTLSCQL